MCINDNKKDIYDRLHFEAPENGNPGEEILRIEP